MMLRTALIVLMLATAGCGRASILGPSAGDGLAAFQALDTNGDGVLSREESGIPAFGFAGLDGNGDGVLSFLEWNAETLNADLALQIQQSRETIRDTAIEPHR